MSAEQQLRSCPDCGALVPEIDGPTHRYLGASPGCWAVYGEVLEKEFGDYRYWPAHQLTGDTYCVQHPEKPSPQTISSVAIHLIGLHLQLERGFPPEDLAPARQQVSYLSKEGKVSFHWLEPPTSLGEVTVLYVREAESPAEHIQRAEEWARSAWDAWSEHHDTIRRWADGGF